MIISISLCLLISFVRSSPTASSPPLLLLISFDGFRWDYPDIYQLPNFNSLIKRGVRVKHIDNSFATVTFPSHFTMITGLFEETHGIVANIIYDPILNASATVKTMNDTKWWSQNAYSQPIWVSNQLAKDSNQRRSGAIAWPGCSTPINGHLPYRYEEFDYDRKFDTVLKRIFEWFNEPIGTRINFGATYHLEPDATGHKYGPISSEMNKTLKECDDYVGLLLKSIDDNEYLKQNLNVIITADHGMHAVNKSHQLFLEQYIDKSLCSAYGSHSLANIFVNKASDIDRLYANLSKIENYEVYKKSQIPDEYHYKSNVRIGDILIVGKIGYQIVVPGDRSSNLLGNHGYDNRAESMHPIFYGFGPAFRSNLLAEPFRNVDIYPLMSYILRLDQRNTNGSLDNVKHILVDFSQEKISPFLVIFLLISVIVMAIVYAICACRHSRKFIYAESNIEPQQYFLLNNDVGSTNNLVVSESEDEQENT
ncbi:unnamed protein product [Rotaria magnacalcarata]|uniref:Uncharacterized protein n=3 Tax=Rotaria magnacalcarata TaxID=392030 RepID=A0A819MB40_9BILA|nr:unnamed protein product [Rotaria magnacalcarata]CAF3976754.1 unnamed protein product [Rotaria magnacalcarata]